MWVCNSRAHPTLALALTPPCLLWSTQACLPALPHLCARYHPASLLQAPRPSLPSRSQHRHGDDDAMTITPPDRVVVVSTRPHCHAHFTHIPPWPSSHPTLALTPSRSQHRCGGRYHSPSSSHTLAGPYPHPSSPPMVHPECLPHLCAQHLGPRSILGNYQIWPYPDTFNFENEHMFLVLFLCFLPDSISFVCRYMD
jgi:hypothetical protein